MISYRQCAFPPLWGKAEKAAIILASTAQPPLEPLQRAPPTNGAQRLRHVEYRPAATKNCAFLDTDVDETGLLSLPDKGEPSLEREIWRRIWEPLLWIHPWLRQWLLPQKAAISPQSACPSAWDEIQWGTRAQDDAFLGKITIFLCPVVGVV